MKENFVKDRKVFVAASASFLGYFVLLYFVIYAMGQAHWIPLKLLPVLIPGTPLTHLVSFCSFFMILRVTQRITWVGLTYGLGPGLLSVPRLIVGNVLNGLATFRALKVFSDSRRGKAAVRWDNTQHLEGIGDMGAAEQTKSGVGTAEVPIEEVLTGLISNDPDEIVKALRAIPAEADPLERAEVIAYVRSLVSSKELRIRAALAQTLGRITWSELTPTLFHALNDPDSVVRLNAARSLLERPRVGALLEQAFIAASPRAVDALIRVIEQDRKRQSILFDLIRREDLSVSKATIIVNSPILRKRLIPYLQAANEVPGVQAVGAFEDSSEPMAH